MKRFAVLLAILVLLRPAPARAQRTDSLLARAARTYAGLQSFSADFHQLITDPMLGDMKSAGHLAQQGPSHFAMRFTDPPHEAIVVDGTHAWVYTPSTTPGQVLRFPAPAGEQYGFNLLAWLLDRPLERYQAHGAGSAMLNGQTADGVRLIPTDPALPFDSATVWLGHRSALPQKVEIYGQGQRGLSGTGVRTVTLDQIRTNERLPAKMFRFTVPDGVRVVDQ